jgi:hypothetical protein
LVQPVGLGSPLFQKTAISTTPKKRTIQLGKAFYNAGFKPGFESVKFYTKLLSLNSSRLCKIDAINIFLALS